MLRVSHRHAENKAAGFRSDDHVVVQILHEIDQTVDSHLQAVRILEDRRNITEHNARLRKIRDGTYIITKCFHLCSSPAFRLRPQCRAAY